MLRYKQSCYVTVDRGEMFGTEDITLTKEKYQQVNSSDSSDNELSTKGIQSPVKGKDGKKFAN